MLTIIAAIFVFGIIVLVHEWGHFITAKMTRMRVDEFAIGFGPTIYRKQKGETVYSLRIIPLGGFNKIAGMTVAECEEENIDANRAFVYKATWAKCLVILAGAIMNFILSAVLFILFFLVQGVSIVNEEPIVGSVFPNTPAAYANLKEGDRIIQIGDRSIERWEDISPTLQYFSQKKVSIKVIRGHEEKNLTVIPRTNEGKGVMIGISPEMKKQHVGLTEAAKMAIDKMAFSLREMLINLWDLAIGKGSSTDLAGPVGIAHMAGDVASTGFWNLLWFTGILSLNLGLINLLPLPVLDGGHLVIILIEFLIGKKLPEKAIYYIQMTGITLLGTIFLWATGNDIMRFLR